MPQRVFQVVSRPSLMRSVIGSSDGWKGICREAQGVGEVGELAGDGAQQRASPASELGTVVGAVDQNRVRGSYERGERDRAGLTERQVGQVLLAVAGPLERPE